MARRYDQFDGPGFPLTVSLRRPPGPLRLSDGARTSGASSRVRRPSSPAGPKPGGTVAAYGCQGVVPTGASSGAGARRAPRCCRPAGSPGPPGRRQFGVRSRRQWASGAGGSTASGAGGSGRRQAAERACSPVARPPRRPGSCSAGSATIGAWAAGCWSQVGDLGRSPDRPGRPDRQVGHRARAPDVGRQVHVVGELGLVAPPPPIFRRHRPHRRTPACRRAG